MGIELEFSDNKKYYVETRREIIENWLNKSDLIMNKYCCPACKEILYIDEKTNKYRCENYLCKMSK